MSFVLNTPEQINMWVLLSRRHQLALWLKGEGKDNAKAYQKPGLVKWCRENITGAEKARTARDCVVPVEYAIVEAGGPQDFSIINVHVMFVRNSVLYDAGVFSDMAEVEANPEFVKAYTNGTLEIVYTMDEPRDANGMLYMAE